MQLRSLAERRMEERQVQHYLRRLFATTPDAWVTRTLLIANVSVFLAMVFSGVSPLMPDLPSLWGWGALYGPLVAEGELWRMLTATFVHGGLIHLGVNMWVLLQAGPLVERLFGNRAYLALYLLAGWGGTVASLLWNPEITSVGASGAIFGVVGALLGYLSRSKGEMPPQLWRSLRRGGLLFVVVNSALGFAIPGIDNAGHIGGLIAGFAAGYILVRPLGAPSRHSWGARTRAMTLGVVLAALTFVGLERVPEDSPREDLIAVESSEPLLRAGRPDDAIVQAQRILEFRPENVHAVVQLARALAATEQLDEARTVLTRVNDLASGRDDWGRVAALREYFAGRDLLAAGLDEAAFEHLATSASRDPTFAPAHLWAAEAALRLGDEDYARRAIAAARNTWPGYAPAR